DERIWVAAAPGGCASRVHRRVPRPPDLQATLRPPNREEQAFLGDSRRPLRHGVQALRILEEVCPGIPGKGELASCRLDRPPEGPLWADLRRALPGQARSQRDQAVQGRRRTDSTPGQEGLRRDAERRGRAREGV